mgnify:CR=1 FL=1
MIRELTCITCPNGCNLSVEINDGVVVSVTGNECKRGDKYGREEVTAPKRMITAIIPVKNGKTNVTSVKTTESIPKEYIKDAMGIINNSCVDAPVCIGDVVYKNILGTGADIVVTREA